MLLSKSDLGSRRAGNDSNIKGSISCYDCKWDDFILQRKQHFVSVIGTCLFKFNISKGSLVVLSVGKLFEENGHSCEWCPGQPSYLLQG